MIKQTSSRAENEDKQFPIEDTFYCSYFENISLKTIFLLDKKDACNIWGNRIDSSALSYFGLPENSWIDMDEAKVLGEWITSYNNDTNLTVERILRDEFDWGDEENILFFLNNENALKTKWKFFLEYWDCFLAIESDNPLIILENSTVAELLSFTSTGMILKFSYPLRTDIPTKVTKTTSH